jgi:CO/xanthine dehydrogenase Mo-binding subunit
LGVRAAGEGTAVSPPAAFANAVEDALDGRCKITEMPLTPNRVFAHLKEAGFV